ncbi:Uma2 family endonuclease [Leptolyngbya sp. FACHB-261]|uniref:Uma2 family endonuclease n=1 Tax=Leptolyngbya sp. FACHB-261 TaxID=2692806 RepID=UPI001682E107|nr:Uma2 family endonuclease [Leptolyngbya sp. FACHB-261]MBD2101383.1 Uma2 family endonuclease [Leptolyngbya sp. FACHB-261]
MLTEIRQLSVRDYHCMVETGILAVDERVELLAGQIFRMAAKGTAHSAVVTRVERLLKRCLGEQVVICLQDPVQLDDFSEPEPDIAVVRVDPLEYEDHHPRPSEIYWLTEVADITLKRDLEIKASLYAQSGISEYWVLDVNEQQLHVFRSPSPKDYESKTVLSEEQTISPLTFPNCKIAIRELLRPREQ